MGDERRRTAIFGGSFDPVHNGHLFVAEEVLNQLDYDRVLFVPARVPPHKSEAPRASADQRLHMLSLAIRDNPSFTVDTFEIARDTVSFTIHTVRHLLEAGSVEGRPGLVIGADLIQGFEQWREADEIERLTDIILVRRPGEPDPSRSRLEEPPSFKRKHTSLDNLTLRISSSEVRERVRAGKPYRYLLPPSVYEYIETNGLYR